MAFDFDIVENEISLSQTMGYIELYQQMVDEINKCISSAHHIPARKGKYLSYATLCQDKKGNYYIDCYKSNWDRYKTMQIYQGVWTVITKNLDIAETVKWNLNPYLAEMRLSCQLWHKAIYRHSGTHQFTVNLDIPLIKRCMDLMYSKNTSFHNHTTYPHTVHINGHINSFANSQDELQEFDKWIKHNVHSPLWILKPSNWRTHNKKEKTYYDLCQELYNVIMK